MIVKGCPLNIYPTANGWLIRSHDREFEARTLGKEDLIVFNRFRDLTNFLAEHFSVQKKAPAAKRELKSEIPF